MMRRELLDRARALLSRSKIDDAALEAELILRFTLKIGRASLFAESDIILTNEQEADFWGKIERRLKGVPSAYITGVREFYGLEFYVDDNVLIPRPETELLVEKTIDIALDYQAPVITDIGTGCGNIAVSLAANLPRAKIYATDISQKALDIARRNCERHHVEQKVHLLAGDLCKPLIESVDIIVANLPYVRTIDVPSINTGGFEPRLALDGGKDGLDIIRRLCNQLDGNLTAGGSLLLEIGVHQKTEVVELLHKSFPSAEVQVFTDLNHIDRVVYVRR